jgi:uncharacterized membrane protein YphA (DoxX/SURF4 family)
MTYYLISLVLSAALAFVFIGAGRNKLTKSMDDLAAAGLGWVKSTTPAVVRLIAVLELLGAAGVILAPAAAKFAGLTWALGFGVAAAAGLALTMVVAIILHVSRKEIKYTWKMNIGLLVIAVADALVIAQIS